jgi:putative (di)nucleoside polyphosphate hydrolase
MDNVKLMNETGYRLGVGMILINPERQVFWAKRAHNVDAWQFPQGGLQAGETAEEAMFRELREEIGLEKEDVKILTTSRTWLKYKLPHKYLRLHTEPLCIGQKQKWFLLELCSSELNICLTKSESPEFDGWCWVDYWTPPEQVIEFKRKIYKRVLREFEPVVFPKPVTH